MADRALPSVGIAVLERADVRIVVPIVIPAYLIAGVVVAMSVECADVDLSPHLREVDHGIRAVNTSAWAVTTDAAASIEAQRSAKAVGRRPRDAGRDRFA